MPRTAEQLTTVCSCRLAAPEARNGARPRPRRESWRSTEAMPGMNSGLNVDDPTLVAAFRSALLHQAIIALAIFAVLSVGWVSVRERQNPAGPGTAQRPAEPAAHRVL